MKQVNNSVHTEKKQAYSQLFNAISLLCDNEYNFNWNEEYNCFIPESFSNKKNPSKALVNKNLYLQSNEKPREKDGGKLYKSLEWFRKLCEEDRVSKYDVYKAAKSIYEHLQWLYIERGDGSKMAIEPYAKGTERYCKKLNGRVLDITNELCKKDMDCAFITLTCDSKKYKNLADMWQNYLNKEVRPVIENLRKNYNMEYVATMESTLKKRPHIHILAFFPKGLFPELSKLKNETVLKFGKLYNYINERKLSQEVKIKVVKGKYKAFYLTKYIGKGVTKSVFKAIQEPAKITNEDWKLINEFVFLTAFRKRKVIYTRKGSKNKNVNVSSEEKVSVLSEERKKWENSTFAEQRAYLNSICIKSLLKNKTKVYSMSNKEYLLNFKHSPERKQELTEEEMKIFKKKGRLIYSEENFYTLFISFVENPLSSPLNYKFYWNGEEGVFDLFTDNYNLNDDKEFINCCRDLCVYYFNKCLKEGYSLQEVISQKIGLTKHKKQRLIAFGTFDDIASADPKDIYFTPNEWQDWKNKIAEINYKLDKEQEEIEFERKLREVEKKLDLIR